MTDEEGGGQKMSVFVHAQGIKPVKPGRGQRYTYRVLQTIQNKHILL